VLVVVVVRGSPAARAGLRAGTRQITVDGESALVGGDVIVSVAGKDIRSPAQLIDAVSARRPGDTISLEVSRNHHERSVRVKLGNAP
jgi:S1-C subfamily serine protease